MHVSAVYAYTHKYPHRRSVPQHWKRPENSELGGKQTYIKLEVFREDIYPTLFYGIIVEQSGPDM